MTRSRTCGISSRPCAPGNRSSRTWCSGTTPRWRVTWRTRRTSGARRLRGTTRRKRSKADAEVHPWGPQRLGRVGRQDPVGAIVTRFARQPVVMPLHRLTGLEGADLENGGAHAFFQPAPHNCPIVARDHDVEHDRPTEAHFLGRTIVFDIVESQRDGNTRPDARTRRGRDRKLEWRDTRGGHVRSPDHKQSREGRVTGHGVTCRDPSSSSMFLSGLNTSIVPDELPPHRMPANALADVYTGEPLSPAPTIWTEFSTIVWQIWLIFVPETLTVTHVMVTWPCVQPVVRPTLLIVSRIEN